MDFFDNILNDDSIWVVLLLFLVLTLPEKGCQPVVNNVSCGEGCNKKADKCNKDIIYRRTKSKKERRQLTY